MLPTIDISNNYPQNASMDSVIGCFGKPQHNDAIDFPISFIYNFSYGLADYKARLVRQAERLEPYNKFSALLAKKICYLRLLSSSAGLGVSISFDCLLGNDELVKAYNSASLTAFPNMLEPFG